MSVIIWTIVIWSVEIWTLLSEFIIIGEVARWILGLLSTQYEAYRPIYSDNTCVIRMVSITTFALSFNSVSAMLLRSSLYLTTVLTITSTCPLHKVLSFAFAVLQKNLNYVYYWARCCGILHFCYGNECPVVYGTVQQLATKKHGGNKIVRPKDMRPVDGEILKILQWAYDNWT